METLILNSSARELREVAEGKKRIVTREIRPGNARRFVELNGEEECVGIIKYEKILLQNERMNASILAAIQKIMLMEIEDEKGQLVYYEQNGKRYQAVDIDFHLGAILDISGLAPNV